MSEPADSKLDLAGLFSGGVEMSELAEALMDKLEGWALAGVAMLPNVLLALFVLTLGWFAGKYGGRLVAKTAGKVSNNAKANAVFSTLARVAIVGGSVFVALGLLELDKTVASLLAGVGVVGLALGFAFQDIAANFMSGILMAFRHEFRQGDIVQSNDFEGRVTRITLRSTHLRKFSGEEVIIPNQDVFSSPLENLSKNRNRRVDVAVGVAYGSDLDEVERVTTTAIESLSCVQEGRDIDVLFTSFGGSSIDLVARFWVDYVSQREFLVARSDAIKAIAAAYDEAGIDIPFPIRTLRIPSAVGSNDPDERPELSEAANA